MIGLWTWIILICLGAAVLRLFQVLPHRFRTWASNYSSTRSNNERWQTFFRRADQCRLMVVLGSGGHTSEMQTMMRALSDHQFEFKEIFYVIANSDSTSAKQLRQSEIGNSSTITDLIPRSREVGQSYISSVFTTLYSILFSVYLVWKRKPDVVLCNGPGTCIPVCAGAFLWKYLGLLNASTVFVESMCRVDTLSLTGKLLYPVADGFFVQWPELQKKYPKCSLVGWLY
eukprot:gb/GECG01004284.1/.p1 GENE.gb/GECG01004284.1/~~gb/GECG01004284.1/.p1  ORF type:complete len:229 (+),score=11.31 gb/GECG01004284.1/:1-687(+)